MTSQILKLVISAAATSLLLAACSGPAADPEGGTEEPITLRLGHTLTTTSPYHYFGTTFAEEVEKTTDGRVTVDVYPSSQLGGETEMLTAVRNGDQDVFIAAQATLENTIPKWQIFSMPYLFDDIDHANEMLQSETGTEYLDMLQDEKLHGLAWLSAIERDVFSTKPLNFPDLSGFKVRLMQSDGYISAYEALGANPTPMAYSELYVSLQQGAVDGGDTSPDQFVEDKFLEVAPYLYMSQMHYLPAVAIMGERTLERLPEDLRDAVSEAARTAAAAEIDFYGDAYENGLQIAADAGVEVLEIDLDSSRAATADVREQMMSTIPDGAERYETIRDFAS